MASSDYDHNYYTLPHHGQLSSRHPDSSAIHPPPPPPPTQSPTNDPYDRVEATQWIPSSSSPPRPPTPNSSSATSPLSYRRLSSAITPHSSPQRPVITTSNLPPPATHIRVNGLTTAAARPEDDSPDPHEFYRQFPDPFTSATSSNATVADDLFVAPDDIDDMTTSSYQRKTVASAARSQGPVSKFSTLNTRNGTRTAYRASSLSSEVPGGMANGTRSASSLSNSRSKQPSLKDLVDRFNQSSEDLAPPVRQTPSRNTSANNVSFLRSRTPSGQTVTIRSLDTSVGREQQQQSIPTKQIRSRRRSSSRNISNTGRSPSAGPPRPPKEEEERAPPMIDRGDSFSSHSSQPLQFRSGQSRVPLFGEVLAVDSEPSDAGYGIANQQRRGSEGSLYPPSPMRRNMEYSPSSPTAWYLSSGLPPPSSSSFHRDASSEIQPNGLHDHRRSQSDLTGVNVLQSSTSFVAKISPPPDSPTSGHVKRSSQSKIPLSTRRQSPPSSRQSPPSTRSSSSLGTRVAPLVTPPHGRSSLPKPNRRSNSPDPRRPKTPPRTTSRRIDVSPAENGDKSSGSLKAYISAPMPKKSPPLRSSRPRQPVSAANTSTARRTVADRYSSISQESSRDRDLSSAEKPPPKKLPELGGVDFAARREKIQRAFTKSVRESEKKEEIRRKRLTKATEQNQLEQARRERNIAAVARGQDKYQGRTDHDREKLNVEKLHGDEEPVLPTPSESPVKITVDRIENVDQSQKSQALRLDTVLPSTKYIKEDSNAARHYQSPDSPTLGMPGGFPDQDEYDMERTIPTISLDTQQPLDVDTSVTPIDLEPQTEQPTFSQSTPRTEQNVLSQIMQMRNEERSSSPSHFDDMGSEPDELGSIQIALGSTPLDDGRQVRQYSWNDSDPPKLSDGEGMRWSSGSFGSSAIENTPKILENRYSHSSNDSPSGSGNLQWNQIEYGHKQPRNTMDSEAYSTINRVLDQYHPTGAVSEEMMDDFQRQVLGYSPELARQGGWDPARVTQLYLQELAKGKSVPGKQIPELSKMDTNIGYAHEENFDPSLDAITPITEIDHDAADTERPRGYQLSDGGWSSQRESLTTDGDPRVGTSSASLRAPDDWIDASPSMADWLQSEKNNATPVIKQEIPPPPPPKDVESPYKSSFGKPSPVIREDAATPRQQDGRPVLPEIKSAGEGLGIAMQLEERQDSPTLHPSFPTHSPPLPPPSSEVMASSSLDPPQASSKTRNDYSPSVYTRNPPSSIFPRLFPEGRAAGPTSVRLEDDSSNSRSPGTPVPPSQTPPTSESRSQERSSADAPRQSLDVPREESGPSPEQKRLNKRRFVIKELVDTEKSFQQDMTVTDEIYRGTASPPLNADDVKVLFGNSEQICAFSKMFLESLKQAANSVYVLPSSVSSKRGSASTGGSLEVPSLHGPELSDDEKDRNTSIGEAFGKHMAKMEKVYSEYLRNHDAANKRLVKIQNLPNVVIWLKECRANADDLTTAWSLDSLLVKPVQRILKYPLLLTQLLEVTPENHPDFTALDFAVREMTGTSHRINDMKKRTEVIEKAVGRKRKESDVRTGLSKAFGRRTEKFRQQVGLSDMFEDRAYAEVSQKFGTHFMQLHLVVKDIETYTVDIQTWVDKFIGYVAAIDGVLHVAQSSQPHLESKWRKFGQSMREMSTVALVEHKSSIKKSVIEPMLTLLRIHDGPQKIMAKRNKRIMDYAKLRAIRDRGDKPDKRTVEQGEQFVTLNDTLKDELPKLFQLTTKLMEACLGRFINIQMQWQALWQSKIKTILEETNIPASIAQLIEDFNSDFEIVSVQVASLGVCNGALLAEAVNFLSPATTLADDRSASSSGRPTPASRHRTSSMNSDKSPSLPTPEFVKRQSASITPVSFGGLDYIPAHSGRTRSSSQTQRIAMPTPPTSEPVPYNPASYAPTASLRSYSSNNTAPTSTRPSTSSNRGYSYDTPATVANGNYFSAGMGTQRPPTPTRPFSNVFSSALPLSDSPTSSPQSASRPDSRLGSVITPVTIIPPQHHHHQQQQQQPQQPQQQPQAPLQLSSGIISGGAASSYNVLFLAASLYEFNIDRARKEAGYPYLTYVPGEIFDVIGEKGELWLAKNQDDPGCLVGWIWCKHFARLEGDMGGMQG